MVPEGSRMLVVPTGGEIGMPAIEPPRVPWASPHRDTVHSRRGIKAAVTGRFVDRSSRVEAKSR
jgi:hypothetical protein